MNYNIMKNTSTIKKNYREYLEEDASIKTKVQILMFYLMMKQQKNKVKKFKRIFSIDIVWSYNFLK